MTNISDMPAARDFKPGQDHRPGWILCISDSIDPRVTAVMTKQRTVIHSVSVDGISTAPANGDDVLFLFERADDYVLAKSRLDNDINARLADWCVEASKVLQAVRKHQTGVKLVSLAAARQYSDIFLSKFGFDQNVLDILGKADPDTDRLARLVVRLAVLQNPLARRLTAELDVRSVPFSNKPADFELDTSEALEHLQDLQAAKVRATDLSMRLERTEAELEALRIQYEASEIAREAKVEIFAEMQSDLQNRLEKSFDLLRDRDVEIKFLAQDNALLRQQVEGTQAELHNASTQLHNTATLLQEAQFWISETQASKSYKLAAPLRKIRALLPSRRKDT